MKINTINNTNFKGLFTDRMYQNNGNWKMEYSPYSWEKKTPSEFGMANQAEWSIFDDTLPDNEKKFMETYPRKSEWEPKRGREFCRDIFGTEFYYHDFDRKIIRKTITEVPAMDRETSLTVLNKKLQQLIKMKEVLMNEKVSSIISAESDVNSASYRFNEASADVKKGYFSRKNFLEYSYKIFDEEFSSVKNSALKTIHAFQDYIKLNNSLNNTKKQVAKNTTEIELLKSSRESGNLIDISRRDIYDPNKPLWESLQTMIKTKTLETSKKIVALPHRSISIQEIIKALGSKIKGSDASAEIIKYVDKLIESRL